MTIPRRSRERVAAVVDPGLPASVASTVHRLARQHPDVLQNPDAPLPRWAGVDLAELARGARVQAIVAAGAVVVVPLLVWMQREMQRNLGSDTISSGTFLIIMITMVGAVLVINMLREWHQVHTPGGRATVARELAEARGRYLLRGTDLTDDAWAAVVRAQRAMNLVLASTWLVSPVETVDRDAFAQGIWAMARAMAKGGSAASGETFAAAIEVYSQRIDEANKINMAELVAHTRPPAGTRSPALAEAVKRADSAGAHALALARL
ncbi:hypothetical protein ACFWVF_19095 [Streptomyces sp. NPDC058659]|uniref:hypothetical protein n=1 Tax=Streptomyces sp. NPDC058659 TaxID=3346581 RepID=UPI00364DD6E3